MMIDQTLHLTLGLLCIYKVKHISRNFVNVLFHSVEVKDMLRIFVSSQSHLLFVETTNNVPNYINGMLNRIFQLKI